MLLKELFSQKETDTKKTQSLVDDVCFYLMNQDDLQKEYFLPVVNELKRKKILDNVEECYTMFKPLVETGCQSYYEEFDLGGKYEDTFTESCMEEICKKFTDEQVQHIKNGQYDSGA